MALEPKESTRAREDENTNIHDLEICVENEEKNKEWLLSEGWQNVTWGGFAESTQMPIRWRLGTFIQRGIGSYTMEG